jgi:hypothetical protein
MPDTGQWCLGARPEKVERLFRLNMAPTLSILAIPLRSRNRGLASEGDRRAGAYVGAWAFVASPIVFCCIAAAARSFVLPPPTVAAYFLDANKDGNRITAEPRVISTLKGNCAEMSDIIVDLEERAAWHWPKLMHSETALRLLSL